MGRIKTIARRSFLVGSAAITGGVAFGVYMAKKPHGNPNLASLEEGAASFNPWVMIDSEKITLITPHADKGQGVRSAQAVLLAEELDLEMDQFETTFGTPSPAYWNRGLAASIEEQLGMPVGFVIKMMGMQVTGGSSSMPDVFLKLREAGASARETLKLAAAQEAGVDVAELKTESGHIIFPDGQKRPYTEFAARAATIEPVQDVPLKEPSEWRLIGKPTQRIDMVEKSTGTLSYGIDIQKEGMVYAAVRVNPRQGGAVNGYDASKAQTMRGVSHVLDVTGGAAVIADNTWRAIQAVNAIDFDWGPAPYLAEQSEHWDKISASFTEEFANQTERDDGDVENALNDGEVIEAEYRSPYVAHQPLEPLNATVLVTDERVDVWAGQQIPRQVEVLVAKITGHDVEDVYFHNYYMGGSFGHRLEFEFIKQTAEVANQLRGTPVKMTYSREEDFLHDFPRHISMGKLRGKVEDGKVNAIDFQIAGASVLASQMPRSEQAAPGPDPTLAEGSWNNPYDFPHIRARSFAVPDLAPVSSWRAVGAPGAGFMFDGFLDELIHHAGADPLEERIRLMGNHDVARKTLEAVGEMSNWGNMPTGRYRGVAFVESFGVPCSEIVEISLQNDAVKIENVWVACDVGTIVDPVNFENLVQGGVVWGLGHAINSEITYADGMAQQQNYYDAEGMRIYQCPQIHVRGLENGEKVRGIGEPPVPPAAPALANAIFAATGTRLREMPFNKFVDFV